MNAIVQSRSVDDLLDDLRASDRRINALVADARHYMREGDDAIAADRCSRVIDLLEGMRDLVDRARALLLRERETTR